MPLRDEFELIRQWTNVYQSTALQQSLGVRVGIGDDAAVVEWKSGFQLVLSTDTMVQDIHFNHKTMGMADVGFKAMAAALSDLAAMGAIPRYALVSLTLPQNTDLTLPQQLYKGLYTCAGKYGVAIVGGDTTSSPGSWVITIQVIGEVEAGKALLRSSACPGDVVFITGHLGCSAAGLDYLNSECHLEPTANQLKAVQHVVEKHQRPLPQIRAGRALLQSGCCHALNDISDGLASEAWEIAEASHVGILLDETLIPIDPNLTIVAELSGKTPRDWILFGGEDYHLIGTVSEAKEEFVERELGRRQLDYHRIGRVTDLFTGVQLLEKTGKTVDLLKQGYNHFT